MDLTDLRSKLITTEDLPAGWAEVPVERDESQEVSACGQRGADLLEGDPVVKRRFPEVLMGARATKSSDLYGLGASMYALLIGHPQPREPRRDHVDGTSPHALRPAGLGGSPRGSVRPVVPGYRAATRGSFLGGT